VKLGIKNFRYRDLYDNKRLQDLALAFDRHLEAGDGALFQRFESYRIGMQSGIACGGLSKPEESALLIAVSRPLGTFLEQLFQTDAKPVAKRTQRDAEVARFKKEFVAKRVAKVTAIPEGDSGAAVGILVRAIAGGQEHDLEFAVAVTANRLLDFEREYPRGTKASAPSPQTRAALGQLRDELRPSGAFVEAVVYRQSVESQEAIAREAAAVHALGDLLVDWLAAQWKHGQFDDWTSFRLPKPIVFDHLVETERANDLSVVGPSDEYRRRDGFKLTDARMTSREVTDEANYCIYCHERMKDSCATGIPAAPLKPGVEKDDKFKVNPLGVPLTGCPLDERIGEMNALRKDGDSIAALAMVMIDNPMCPGTGHRICNDCMKSCIFQKQDPVNIPQIETGALTDVLWLPWGFEIYSLLTRWNPLNVRRPMALPYNGKNVLIVGLGPAGYTLAHYLANEGFGVVAIDALKIEPIDSKWLREPIKDAHTTLWEDLDERILAGFGGVSEYGITVRWDKNFLKVIRIALERKNNIRVYGGVRFGGTLTIEDAFDKLGFDHIAIAAGAGTPTIVRMKNNLIRGIRKASDFLMALQLTGAGKRSAMANLQVRLPALVIGGGLTAIDTATELFAYYPLQVQKILDRYETLSEGFGEAVVRGGYDGEEQIILDEFLEHGRAVRAERVRAVSNGDKPNFIPLVRAWGGVTIAYRKGITDAPAYRLNHEEVIKAFEEGIAYAESLSPIEALADEYGHVKSLLFEKQINEDGRWKDSGNVIELAARSVMVAAGTSPNVIYEKEHPGTFKLDKYGQFFQSYAVSTPESAPELIEVDANRDRGFFTSYQHPSSREKVISFYGDNHPRYAGNVVKAMASAKDGYPFVTQLFAADLMRLDRSPEAQTVRESQWNDLLRTLDDGLLPVVHAVNRLTPTIIEVVIRAPFASRHFEPGQFFRLQNFEENAQEVDGTRLTMEGIALTGAWTDPERGLLSLIVLELGGSSRLVARLKVGEPVVVMGPTGAPTEIPRGETVLLAGGGLGNAVLFSIARAFKLNSCKVVYFAGYKKKDDVFKRDEIEAGTDQVIWSVDAGDPIAPRRPQDRGFTGNIVQSMLHYAQNAPETDLTSVQRLIAIGSDGMMRAVKDARHGVLAPYLSNDHVGIGSINSPMQCMMKQVCAQCLQRHVDPVTGKEKFVFSCFNQDQPLDEVDFTNLRARLRQNTVVEKMTNLWLTRLLAKANAVEAEVPLRAS
jgi:NADPH-dependent glutamate synthase beta subunit-like oxidoreductase/NAD(P)H-flavin reductase